MYAIPYITINRLEKNVKHARNLVPSLDQRDVNMIAHYLAIQVWWQSEFDTELSRNFPKLNKLSTSNLLQFYFETFNLKYLLYTLIFSAIFYVRFSVLLTGDCPSCKQMVKLPCHCRLMLVYVSCRYCISHCFSQIHFDNSSGLSRANHDHDPQCSDILSS